MSFSVHIEFSNQAFLLELVNVELVFYLLFPVFVANDVVVHHIFQDELVWPVGVKRVVFLEIDRKVGLYFRKGHFSPSLLQNALKNFVLSRYLWVNEPVFGESELLIKLNLFWKELNELLCPHVSDWSKRLFLSSIWVIIKVFFFLLLTTRIWSLWILVLCFHIFSVSEVSRVLFVYLEVLVLFGFIFFRLFVELFIIVGLSTIVSMRLDYFHLRKFIHGFTLLGNRAQINFFSFDGWWLWLIQFEIDVQFFLFLRQIADPIVELVDFFLDFSKFIIIFFKSLRGSSLILEVALRSLVLFLLSGQTTFIFRTRFFLVVF